MDAVTARAGYMMGENVDRAWSPEHARAWEGFLELSRQLRRAAGGVLEPVEGLTVSMLGIMGRLARADDRTLRQTDIAEAMGLSFSRVSRLTDTLEVRGLVERRPCPTDARAVNVTLTSDGQALRGGRRMRSSPSSRSTSSRRSTRWRSRRSRACSRG